MDKLYLETEHGRLPIDEEIISKYGLKKGGISPCSRCRIADESGDSCPHKEEEKPMMEEEGPIFSVAEIIDFGQAADSNDGQ